MSTTATLLRLAAASIRNRRLTALLTIGSIAISVMLVLGVERVRTEARASFANTISGADLIVGARSGDLNLLLYSVFRIGSATNNLSWQSFREIASRPEVAWAIPISLGDSHRGFRVMGTNTDYFRFYRFARTRQLEFAAGRPFETPFEAVLGADVARQLQYAPGQSIVVAHGLGSATLVAHYDKPFTVVGILRKTGTPVDRTVHISLEGIEAMHIDWQAGGRRPGAGASADDALRMDLSPEQITAFIVGLRNRVLAFRLQREVNDFRAEPLMAIIPGVALQQLWELVGVVELALLAVSALVVVAGLLGLLTSILTSVNERRREMAILRALGASPWQIGGLLCAEAFLLALAGVLCGLVLLYGAIGLSSGWLAEAFGIFINLRWPTATELGIAAAVLIAATLISLLPAWRAYRHVLADGLAVRI